MITVKKLNKEEIIINADLIETIEANPDCIITLTTGRKITVRDQIEELVKKLIKYKQLTHQTVNVVKKEVEN
jgi:flagellar protein FlbD